jgi:hypothetical protein
VRDRTRLLALLGVLLLLGIILRPVAPAAQDDLRRSSFLSGPEGTRALYLLADELGQPVARAMTPWTAEAPERGVLVVLSPSESPSEEEEEALEAWVRGGGTLIYAPPPGEAGLLERFGFAVGAIEPATASGQEGDTVSGFEQVFTRVPELGADDRPLLTVADGRPTAVAIGVDEGRIAAWADAAPLANVRLRDGDQAHLFVRLVAGALADGGVVRFDEYHHGFRGDGGPARAVLRFLREGPMGRWGLQILFAGLVLLLLEVHRFGSPKQDGPVRRRSPLEHVEAVSGAYRRAGARRTARGLILNGLERRIGRRSADDASLRELRRTWEGTHQVDLVALAAAVDDFEAEMKGWKRAS